MYNSFPLRKDVPEQEKWDLTYLVKDEATYNVLL